MVSITIVGGGSAGWMTAATLLSQFPNKKITLVESPNVSNIGVGESTVAGGQAGFAGITDWFRLIDISDLDFMPHCDAIYKLSIAFKDWYRKDSGTFHYPFGVPEVQQNLHPNDWYLKKIFYPKTPVSDYAESFYPAMSLINQNRLDLGQAEFSYQFDATKLGIWLRDNYCKAKYSNNFTHILAEVKETPLNENGIEHLVLDDGQKLEADLFIDCTGFKSLLLSKALDVPFTYIDDYIPNNYAWATKIPYKDPESQIVNYTNCTAIENGWIWEIPLWSRMGSGYVWSDEFVSSEEALKEFKRGLIKKGYTEVEDLEYHLVHMRCGIHEKLWVKNTCAIGLSAGFIEPLQSNGLQSIHQFLFNLCRILERGHISEWDRREFTTKCHDDFYGFMGVVALSYLLSHRDDTPYWREIQTRELPKDLFTKHFHQAYSRKNYGDRFDNPIIDCMTIGMNWNPIDSHVLKYKGNMSTTMKKNTDETLLYINERKKRWNEQVKNLPSPYQFLKKNIHNV